MATTIAAEESALTSLSTSYKTLAADVAHASTYVTANCELSNASGLLLSPLQPAYNACRDVASAAIAAFGKALTGLGTQVSGALSDIEKTEQANQSVTNKLQSQVGAGTSLGSGGGGTGGGGGYSGGGSSVGGGSAGGGPTGSGGVSTASLGGSADGEVPQTSDPASAGAAAGTSGTTGTSTGAGAGTGATTGTTRSGTAGGTPFTVDVQDNGQSDVVTVNSDGTITVSVGTDSTATATGPTATTPTTAATAASGGATPSASAGVPQASAAPVLGAQSDVTVTVGSGATPDFSVAANGDGGVDVSGVTLGSDTSATSTTDASAYSQPTDSQLSTMAANDPLGRSASELQGAWQSRETFTFSDSAASGLLTNSAAGATTLDVTTLMGLVQQAETSSAQSGGLTWAR